MNFDWFGIAIGVLVVLGFFGSIVHMAFYTLTKKDENVDRISPVSGSEV